MVEYSICVQSILSRDPGERLRLAEDPRTKRVYAYHERLGRTRRESITPCVDRAGERPLDSNAK